MFRFMNQNKPKSLLILFDSSLQERSIDILILIQTQSISTNKHTSHISLLTLFLRIFPFDTLQKLMYFLRLMLKQLRYLNRKRLRTIPKTNSTLIDTHQLLFFQHMYLFLLIFQDQI